MKQLTKWIFSAWLFFSLTACNSLFSGGLISINLVSSNLDLAKDNLEWTVEILNGSSSLITDFLITVDFNFSGGNQGSGTESKQFNLSGLNIESGQVHTWMETVNENELRNDRDFAYLTYVSVRNLEAMEFGVSVSIETYSGNEGRIYN